MGLLDLISKGTGFLNQSSKFLLESLDFQNRNIFEILLYPKSVESNPSDLASLGSAALDSIIAKLYIQSIDVPMLGLTSESYNELKGTKDIEYPTGCSITFIETEAGIVRNYLNNWLKEIVFPVYETDATSGILRTNYVFTENQEGAKKNAIIIPLTGVGLPSTGWVKLEGLKYEKIENLVFSQSEAEPMLITCSFSVDSVWFKTLL